MGGVGGVCTGGIGMGDGGGGAEERQKVQDGERQRRKERRRERERDSERGKGERRRGRGKGGGEGEGEAALPADYAQRLWEVSKVVQHRHLSLFLTICFDGILDVDEFSSDYNRIVRPYLQTRP